MRPFEKGQGGLLAVCGLALSLMISGCATTSGTQDSGDGIVLSEEQNALFQSAMLKMEQENYQAGIDQLEQLTAQNVNSAVPYINIAIAYKKLEEPEKALENLEKALEIEPYNPVASNEYGLLLRKKGQFVEARQTYEKILTKYPDFALANKNLGVLCDIYLKDYPCALDAYRSYSAVVPDDEEAQIWISDLEMRTK